MNINPWKMREKVHPTHKNLLYLINHKSYGVYMILCVYDEKTTDD